MTDRSPSLEELVERSREGELHALDHLLRAIQDDIYNLAVRMLWHPQDAEDATQEILMRIVTNLATFRGESTFTTWAFRVAVNHLLNMRKSRAEQPAMTFTDFGRDLADGISDPPASVADRPDQALLEEEVKIGCTQGMLLCLDRDHRAAYILGEIYDLASAEAAAVLAVSAATFRKRLSRARQRVRAFMHEHCGLVNDRAACRCRKRVEPAMAKGRVDADRLLFASAVTRSTARASVLRRVRDLEALERSAAVYRSHPDYAAPERIREAIRHVVEAGR